MLTHSVELRHLHIDTINTIPDPPTLRSILNRRTGKIGNAALSREIGIAEDVCWNFCRERTKEMKHGDLVKVLTYLNMKPEEEE